MKNTSITTRARVSSSPKVAKLAAPVVKPDASPAWLQSTPNPVTGYFLSMISDGEHLQDVEMSRDQFIALKDILAKMLGYIVEPVSSAVQVETLH